MRYGTFISLMAQRGFRNNGQRPTENAQTYKPLIIGRLITGQRL
jgi:hypothetical protein